MKTIPPRARPARSALVSPLFFALAAALCLALLAAAIPACHSSSAAGAVAMTTLAGGASAMRRANGECYVDCLPGSHCNRATGLCDPLACNGTCASGFVCEETETGSACVPRDQSAQYATRMQEPVSGAQPFGDGQAVNGPHVAAGVSNEGTIGPAGSAEPAPPPPPGSITSRTGSSGGTLSYGGGRADAGPSDAGPGDGGSARIPAAALQTTPTRQKDSPANSAPSAPWLESNPWDPNHAEPLPQMSNPNQPPPH